MTHRGHGWQARWSRVVSAIRIVRSPQQEQALVRELAHGRRPCVLGFVNAYAMNSIVGNAEFFDALMDADILLRDGSGMAMLYRWRGSEPGLNANGTDLIPKIIGAFRGRRVALWGTAEPHLAAAAARCEAEFGVHVVSLEHGFHAGDFYRQRAAATRPDLIVLGMGMPKQELVAHAVRATAGAPALIVCGGAIIDFLGGKLPRAPHWMRRLGIEWVYRLAREPRRLFSRYVIGNPLFLCRIKAWQRSAGEQ